MLGSAPPSTSEWGCEAGQDLRDSGSKCVLDVQTVWSRLRHDVGRRHTVCAWWALEGDLDVALPNSEAERGFAAQRARR